jgi:isocitrate dehydrogenase
VDLVESGKMTKDLAVCIHGDAVNETHYLTTEDFLDAIEAELRKRMVG